MKQNQTLQYIIQLIGWVIVFTFPLFFVWKEAESMTWTRYIGYAFVPVTFVVIFYTNYFLLIDRLLFRKRLPHFLAANILLFVILALVLTWWHDYYFFEIAGNTAHRKAGPPKMMFILRDTAMMALTAALSVAIKMTANWYITENERKELEKARTEAELQNLKSQLNPHFLFNTLNNIYSLIAIDADRAQYAVHNLSNLLRHVLYEDKQPLIPLDKELAFMRNYIELMSLRLSEKVDLQVAFPDAAERIHIAPLLFITLVENAFKHGVSPIAASFIRITLGVEQGCIVDCRIENSNYPKQDNDRSGSGIGLSNLHKRLELLYPGRYTLRTGIENEKYVAQLRIDTRKP